MAANLPVPKPAARLERLVGSVLRTGMGASAVFLTCGLAMMVFTGDQGIGDYIVRAGLIILMATPVTRVIVSIVEYAIERDWVFVALTTTVLIVLIGSVLAGRR
jgi:uncharacterized membrane protein